MLFCSVFSFQRHLLPKKSSDLTIPFSEIIVMIGDSLNDLCMIKNAEVGFVFCAENGLLNHSKMIVLSADFQTEEQSFYTVLEKAY